MSYLKRITCWFLLLALLNSQVACVQYKPIAQYPGNYGGQAFQFYLHKGGDLYKLDNAQIDGSNIKGKITKIDAIQPVNGITSVEYYIEGYFLNENSIQNIADTQLVSIPHDFIKKSTVTSGTGRDKQALNYVGAFPDNVKFLIHDGTQTIEVVKPTLYETKVSGVLTKVENVSSWDNNGGRWSKNDTHEFNLFLKSQSHLSDKYINKKVGVPFNNVEKMERVGMDLNKTYFSSLYLGLGIVGGTIIVTALTGLISYVLIYASGKASADSSGKSGDSSGKSGDSSGKSGDSSGKSGDSGNSSGNSGNSGSGDSGSGNSGSGNSSRTVNLKSYSNEWQPQ